MVAPPVFSEPPCCGGPIVGCFLWQWDGVERIYLIEPLAPTIVGHPLREGEMPKVTCPCCHGTCWIVVYDFVDQVLVIKSREPCGHCEGTGKIEAEVEEDGCE